MLAERRCRPTMPFLLVAALALAPAAAGQLTDQQAAKAFRADAKTATKTHASVVKGVLSAWSPKLKAVQSELQQGFDALAVQDLFFDLADLQVDLYDAMLAAIGDLQLSAYFTLIELGGGDGGTLAGVYPDEFYWRSGTTTEDAMDTVERDTHKALATVEKKLDGLRKKAAKAGTALSVFIERHPDLYEATWNEDASFTPGGRFFTLDVIVAAGDVDEPDDGRILVGGWAGDTAGDPGDVEVWIQGPAGSSTMTTVAPSPDGRWFGSAVALEEGNYLVGARPDGFDVQWTWKVVSVQ